MADTAEPVEKKQSPVKETNDTENEKDITSNVHSANDWEHADLGDKERKEKFLKLMGAAKGDHKGKIVIGDNQNQHKPDDPEKTTKGLETQFQQGVERKLKGGYKGHLGLGFDPESDKTDTDNGSDQPSVEATPDTDVVEERRRVTDDENGKSDTTNTDESTEVDGSGDANKVKETAEKRKSTSEHEDSEKIPKKKPLMSFVKSSDS